MNGRSGIALAAAGALTLAAPLAASPADVDVVLGRLAFAAHLRDGLQVPRADGKPFQLKDAAWK